MNLFAKLYFLIMILFLSCCTRTEEGELVRESAEFQILEVVSLQNVEIKNTYAAVINRPNSMDTIICAFEFEPTGNPFTNKFVIQRYSHLLISTQQINFNFKYFSDISLIAPIPYGKDFDKDGSIDPMVIIERDDRYNISAFSGKTNNSNHVKSFDIEIGRENEHYLIFVCIWRNPEIGDLLIFRKSNRLRSLPTTIDTLIAINIDECSIEFKTALAPAIRHQNYKNYTTNDSTLLICSIDPHNGLSYEGLNDSESYVLTLNSRGEIIRILKISGDKYHNFYFITHTNDSTFWTYSEDRSDSANANLRCIKVNKNDNKIMEKVAVNSNLRLLTINQERLYFLDSDYKLSIHNIETKQIVENVNNIEIGTYAQTKLQNIEHTPGNYLFNKVFFDINEDNINDILLSTPEHQVCLLDGRTGQILGATDKQKNLTGFSVIMGDKPYIVTTHFDNIKIFNLLKTPFSTRIFSLNPLIIIIIISILFSPLIVFFVFKTVYYKNLFANLTILNQYTGIAVIRVNPKIKSNNPDHTFIFTNPEFRKIFNCDNKSKPHIVLHQKILEYIEVSNNLKKSQKIELNLSDGQNNYFLNITISTINLFIIKKYYLISCFDISDSIMNQKTKVSLETAMVIAHSAKTPLATAQLALDFVFRKLEKSNLNISKLLESKRLIIKDSINEASDVLKKVSYIGKEKILSKVNIDLDDFLFNWIEEYGYRYRRRNIEISFESDGKEKPVFLDTWGFGYLLQCACDNSAEAFLENSEKKITIRSFVKNDHILLEIADTASGIDARLADLINKRQQNYHKDYGSGLGFQIIDKVCQNNNSSFRIRRDTSVGSVLEITINKY